MRTTIHCTGLKKKMYSVVTDHLLEEDEECGGGTLTIVNGMQTFMR